MRLPLQPNCSVAFRLSASVSSQLMVSARRTAITILASLVAVCALAAQQPQPQPQSQPQQSAQQATVAEQQAGSVAAGAALFSGQTRFTRGGPACIDCHSAAGLPFPNGGTLGPNLTTAYRRMGTEGIESILTTLYFPTMYPLYKAHQLTPQERADLAAFLQNSSTQTSRGSTLPVFGLAALLFVIFMLIIGYAGRDRLLNVRRNLVANARRQFNTRPPSGGNQAEATAEPAAATTEGEGA